MAANNKEQFVTLSCGCRFRIVGDNQFRQLLNVSFDIEDHDGFPCSATWDLISKGDTKGVFQLENSGMNMAASLKPVNIDQLSALAAILRPSCTQAKRDNKSIANHYIDRKNGIEPVEYFHPSLEPILKDTFGELIYQEQAMAIAALIAGFTMVQANDLRAAIGKKDTAKMAKLKPQFLDGAKATGIVTEKEAEEIFSWIEASQRYGFNKSITGDTVVELEDGMKTILELKVGDKILAPNTKTRENEYVEVKNIFDHGVLDVYEITTESGKKIRCSINHKFLCDNGLVLPLHKIIDEDHQLYNERIDSVMSVGKQQTYDIEVDSDDHLYYGNGIATSNSHAYAYGMIGYLTAWAKVHFSEAFFTAYLSGAKDAKTRAIFINNSKLHNINVLPPDIRVGNKLFQLRESIYFGLLDIDGLGESGYVAIHDAIKELDPICGKPDDWTKFDFLFRFAKLVGHSDTKKLIECGAVSYIDPNRTKLCYELDKAMDLTDREREYCITNIIPSLGKNADLVSVLELLLLAPIGRKGGISTKARVPKIAGLIESLKKPPYALEDTAAWIAERERLLLGVSLTCSEVDSCDTSMANCTCIDYMNGPIKHPRIACKIENVKEITIKNGDSAGKKMAFVDVSDASYTMSVTFFSDAYEKYKHLLVSGNMVMVTGQKDKKRGGLNVEKVWQLY